MNVPKQRAAAEAEAYEAWMNRQLEEALRHPLPQRVVDRLALIFEESAIPQDPEQSGS